MRLWQYEHAFFCLQLDLLACHGYEFLDLWPDPQRSSCRAAFGGQRGTANFMGDESHWHHLAVTWTAASNGTVKVYRDGLLMVEVSFCSCCTPRQPSLFQAGQVQQAGCAAWSKRLSSERCSPQLHMQLRLKLSVGPQDSCSRLEALHQPVCLQLGAQMAPSWCQKRVLENPKR